MKKTIFVMMLIACSVFADPPETRTIDSRVGTAPDLQVYSANYKTYLWTMKNNNAPVDLTTYTPFMWIAASNTAGISTAQCTIVSAASGTFYSVFTPQALNTNGNWVYGVGITQAGTTTNTTTRQGNITITPDPMSQGAATLALTIPIDWNLCTYLHTTNGPYISGSNIAFRSVGSNGQYAVDGLAQTESDPIATNRITIHTNRTDNPHAVTAAQVGAWASTVQFYPSNNPASYVDATITNGHAQLNGIAVHGLGTASTNAEGNFATAAQGVSATNAETQAFFKDGSRLGNNSSWGATLSVTNISSDCEGSFIHGGNESAQLIGSHVHGGFILGYNAGNQTLGALSDGSGILGANSGTELIDGAYGALIVGNNEGSVSNLLGHGSLQLVNLSVGETSFVSGSASLGLGAVTVTNDQAIVAGDASVSHGDGSITASGGFWHGNQQALLADGSVLPTANWNMNQKSQTNIASITFTYFGTNCIQSFTNYFGTNSMCFNPGDGTNYVLRFY